MPDSPQQKMVRFHYTPEMLAKMAEFQAAQKAAAMAPPPPLAPMPYGPPPPAMERKWTGAPSRQEMPRDLNEERIGLYNAQVGRNQIYKQVPDMEFPPLRPMVPTEFEAIDQVLQRPAGNAPTWAEIQAALAQQLRGK